MTEINQSETLDSETEFNEVELKPMKSLVKRAPGVHLPTIIFAFVIKGTSAHCVGLKCKSMKLGVHLPTIMFALVIKNKDWQNFRQKSSVY